ncbi:SEI2 [Linum perenne]
MNSSENPNHWPEEDDDRFSEALDEAFDDFPFYECSICTDQSTSDSTVSESSIEASSPRTTLRRRRISGQDFKGYATEKASLVYSSVTQAHDASEVKSFREEETSVYPSSKEKASDESEIVDSTNRDVSEIVESTSRDDKDSPPARNEDDTKKEEEESASTTAELNFDRGGIASPPGEVSESSASNLLVSIAGLMIKAIGFQLNLLLNFVSFPLWAMYCSYMLATDPFGVTRLVKMFLIRRLLSVWSSTVGVGSSWVKDWLKEHQTKWNFLIGIGWGLLLCCYVCVILCGLLVLAIMVSGFLMRYLVVEPLQIREALNFDYTQSKPVAYVPIVSCAGVDCGAECRDKLGEIRSFKQRFIPPKHKVQASVLMTLPESEYNRNLGMFQKVRLDFLSADGKILTSKSHPCMLKFKSEPIRILLTMFKVVPLVAGYISESQTLRLWIRGFTEGDVPTSCLRVMIEQRAEFGPGGGIPELYDASLTLETYLPFFRRIIWGWKKTIFIWISLITFIMELLFALICCRPVILPRLRPRDASPPTVAHNPVRSNPRRRRESRSAQNQ